MIEARVSAVGDGLVLRAQSLHCLLHSGDRHGLVGIPGDHQQRGHQRIVGGGEGVEELLDLRHIFPLRVESLPRGEVRVGLIGLCQAPVVCDRGVVLEHLWAEHSTRVEVLIRRLDARGHERHVEAHTVAGRQVAREDRPLDRAGDTDGTEEARVVGHLIHAPGRNAPL